MESKMSIIQRGISCIMLLWALQLPAAAETPEEFYRGKAISIYVGYTAGGGYDVYARLLGRHMVRHLPAGATVIIRNMEGAGSLRLANWLYSVAPADGSAFATVGRGVAFDQLLGRTGVQFDAPRFTWIGSMNDEVSVCVSMASSHVTKFSDLGKEKLIVGAAGAGNDDDLFPRIMNAILGTKMQIITAYPGGNDVVLAMERGEVMGRCGWSWSSIKASQPDWITQNKINVLVQLGLSKHADLPNVPLIMDLATNDEERQSLKLIFARQALGRPFLAPPGIPSDRSAFLRSVFKKTVSDPELRAEADRAKIEIEPLTGENLENVINQVFSDTSPQLARKISGYINLN